MNSSVEAAASFDAVSRALSSPVIYGQAALARPTRPGRARPKARIFVDVCMFQLYNVVQDERKDWKGSTSKGDHRPICITTTWLLLAAFVTNVQTKKKRKQAQYGSERSIAVSYRTNKRRKPLTVGGGLVGVGLSGSHAYNIIHE